MNTEGASTKHRILDAAEALFASHGFAETSLRAITAGAGVNLAAVNYHFQSKEALIQAVVARRIEPLNQARIAMLDAVEAATPEGPLPLEDVLRSFVEPTVRTIRSEPGFAALFARLFFEPGEVFGKIFREQIVYVKTRFHGALRRALPEIPDSELIWRIFFAIGAMAHTVSGEQHLQCASDGQCDMSDLDAAVERLIAFVAAGFRAPVSAPKGAHPCHA